MLTMEPWGLIRELRGHGLSPVAIARRLGWSRTTVLKHLAASGPPQYSPRPSGTRLAGHLMLGKIAAVDRSVFIDW